MKGSCLKTAWAGFSLKPAGRFCDYGSKETGGSFRKKYHGNFTNARWVLLDDLGHNDIWTITAEGTQYLMQRFLDEGVVDTSKFDRIPEWKFTPQVTFAQMFQQMMQQSQKTAAQK